MKKILNYGEFVSKNSSMNEANSNMKINEAFDFTKSLIQNVNNESYNKLVKRILGGGNTDLETNIKSEDHYRSPDFKASLIFNRIWRESKKYTDPSSTEFPASVLQNLQSQYLSDYGILETLKMNNIGAEGYVMKSANENLKEPTNIVKLASEGKLIEVIKAKGEYDKLTDSQKRVFETINNKTQFIEDLKSKFYNKPFDSKLGLDPTQLFMYEQTPGFKIQKSVKSDIKSEDIGHGIIRDICFSAYNYYVQGLANVISKHIVDEKSKTTSTQKQDLTATATTQTAVKTKKKVTSRPQETAQSTFNPENLKNFGY